MSDPFLDAHRVAPLTYVISGPQPISIRDQMLRGILVARRLYEEGEIDTVDRPLVVVGAGAGGATAAIEAARIGVVTHLVEIASRPFLAQRLARTRVIDPTQYDWPVDHYRQSRFPWGRHSSLPLSFGNNRAAWLSSYWEWRLGWWQSGLNPRLLIYYGTALSAAPTLALGRLSVSFGPPGHGPLSVSAGALVDAKGFGYEQTAVRDPAGTVCYEGQPFWGPDRFTTLGSGHRVLISGSGDGALQDFIRVLTGLDRAVDVEQRLGLPDHIRQALHSAEDRAHRGRSWSREDVQRLRQNQEGPYFRQLESEHLILVQQALGYSNVQDILRTLVKDIEVSLVYRGPYLDCYYGLNRFIVLLLATYLEKYRYSSRPVLFPSCEISNITSSHRCINSQGTPNAGRASGTYVSGMLVSHSCFDQDHTVTFTSRFCPPRQVFNVIIVRHGLVRTIVPLKRPRHLLPYHDP
jgi:hypothetical protein